MTNGVSGRGQLRRGNHTCPVGQVRSVRMLCVLHSPGRPTWGSLESAIGSATGWIP